ncbi:AIR synthase family protein [Ignisphaera sp. 4213-co]|uniref:AIR synthase family protein n=1 Tax=Ignisphaera cupida TaxID=3050454 RepID=A0ABD4Z832_9CREN|nr:AIR synthase family protein [Ignisphaera sp. 4213-co]MDK6028728.1 AIR synthase family protein [Ignisphaera sp. 4213-co]
MSAKLSPNLLSKYVLSRVGVVDPSVVVGPSIGEDAAIIDLGSDSVLVVHADPITGAVENIGWLAIHIACNDIAVRGAKPKWLVTVLLLPHSENEDKNEELLDSITKQMSEAAKEVGAMIVGGHSEFTVDISRPIISVTAMGIAKKGSYVTTGGARVGDVVLMTKTVAVEGTAILAADFRDVLLEMGVSETVLERGRNFIKRISVVKEAIALAETGLATSMHDPTEGGLIAGLAEIAYASKKSIEIWEEKIPIAEETMAIVKALGIDPLKLISSGTLVATIHQDKADEAIKLLQNIGVEAAVIGKVTEPKDFYVAIHRRSGQVEKIKDVYVKDELYDAWKRFKSHRS